MAKEGSNEAVEAAQGERSRAADGTTAARELLGQLGALRGAQVKVDRSATVSAQVTGSGQALVPGWPVAVEAAAEGPVERFVPEPAP